jgi:cytochrome bd-type quinol oxidase subunit 2
VEERIVTNEEALRSTRQVALILFALVLAFAYWLFPADAMNQPLAQLTLKSILELIASAAIAFFGLVFFLMLWAE